MSSPRFRGWFSDIGFTCRVLIICDMLDEWADTWMADPHSAFRQAIDEVRETALLEMLRWEEAGYSHGYFKHDQTDEEFRRAFNDHQES